MAMQKPKLRVVEGARVVACLGSSSTADRGTYDWIGEVARRPGNESWVFRRFASGGDLAYNGMRRTGDIIASSPEAVIILLGGNDVLASVFPKVARVLGGWKRLPRMPSPDGYRETVSAIVKTLAKATRARVALCSLQPIGEDPSSADPVQVRLNRCVEEYNAILRDVASAERATYLPFYERMQEMIVASPGRAFTRFDFLPFYRDVFLQYVLRWDNDKIGARHGWKVHRDGIHLNSRSGHMLADLVDAFLRAR
jgi:lysophospholipase L1-like esterase